jgi:Domain of unknown function (DUF5666)
MPCSNETYDFSLSNFGYFNLTVPAERNKNLHARRGLIEMSKLPEVLGAAMLCLGLLSSATAIVTAQDPSTPAKNPQKEEQKQAETKTISGTVSAITDSAITIVDTQKAEHTVAITGETKVTKAGKDAALADVKANDVVTVEVKKGADDAWTALKIAVS